MAFQRLKCLFKVLKPLKDFERLSITLKKAFSKAFVRSFGACSKAFDALLKVFSCPLESFKKPLGDLEGLRKGLTRCVVNDYPRGPLTAPKFQRLAWSALPLKGKGNHKGKGKSKGKGKNKGKSVAASDVQGSSGSRDSRSGNSTTGVKRKR